MNMVDVVMVNVVEVRVVREDAEAGLEHHGDFSNVDLRDGVVVVLRVLQHRARADDVLDVHVHGDARRVREVAQAGLLRAHQFGGPVVLVLDQ